MAARQPRIRHRIHPALKKLAIPLAKIDADPNQARLHNDPEQLELMIQSLREFGQLFPIAVIPAGQRFTCKAGALRIAAAKALGWEKIAAVQNPDWDEATATRFALLDNRIPELGDWDPEMLRLLDGLPDIDLGRLGFDADYLERLRQDEDEEKQGAGAGGIEDKATPPPPARPRTKLGDLWVLEGHRVYCGDATDPEARAALLEGELAHCLWTDPPYGVAYTGGTEQKLTIRNDDLKPAALQEFLLRAFREIDPALRPGAPIYVASPSGIQLLAFLEAFVEAGWSLRQTLVWLKDSLVLGHSDYHYIHETILHGEKKAPRRQPRRKTKSDGKEPYANAHDAILYGYKSAARGRLGRGAKNWHGDQSQTSVLVYPRPRSSRDHPTMKPPELVLRTLRNSTLPGQIVLDPFLGSGSTLIACEYAGRTCYGAEIDPAYVDVAVKRWERLTGTKAERRR